jgi:hypothetical protein
MALMGVGVALRNDAVEQVFQVNIKQGRISLDMG